MASATGMATQSGATLAAAPGTRAEQAPTALEAIASLERLETLFKERVKYVVWDFDRTVLNRHSFADRITPEQVAERQAEIRSDLADADLFIGTVRLLSRWGIKLGIASFGRYEVIQAYMNAFFNEGKSSNEFFSRENIITPGCVQIEGRMPYRDGQAMRTGKVLQLEQFLTSYCGVDATDADAMHLARASTLFFDDDIKNVLTARVHGFFFSVACTANFNAAAMQEAVQWVEEEDWAERLAEAKRTPDSVKQASLEKYGLDRGP